MPRHKTIHRKTMEKQQKANLAARAALLAEAKKDTTLKENALKAAKRIK